MSRLDLVAPWKLVIVTLVLDVPNDSHIDEVIVVSLDAESVHDNVLNPIIMTQNCQIVYVLFNSTSRIREIVLGEHFVVVASEEGVWDACKDFDFIWVTVHDEVLTPGRLSNFNSLAMIVHHNMPILFLVGLGMAGVPVRWTTGEEGASTWELHICLHEVWWNEEHVVGSTTRLMWIHL